MYRLDGHVSVSGSDRQPGHRNTDQPSIVDARSQRRAKVILRVAHFIARSRRERRADVDRHGTRQIPVVDHDMRTTRFVLVWPYERPYSARRARLVDTVRIEARPGRPACIDACAAVP